MDRNDPAYQSYLRVLREELVPAMGCTEPIAIAYAAAQASSLLDGLPEAVTVEVSGNIIKNVKSVVVPHTGHLRGIAAAAAAGIVAGDAERQLEVLSSVREEQIPAIRAYLERTTFQIRRIDSPFLFDIRVTCRFTDGETMARIVGSHTNLVQLRRNGEWLLSKPCEETVQDVRSDRSFMSVEGIVRFADALQEADGASVFDRQIACNMAIAEEGMRGDYGAKIGKTLRDAYGDSVHNRARYYAAAASDARMNGCELPVIINSGSGNQGITASVPVIVYAREIGADKLRLYRALAVSNLCTIHQKTRIGTLSAYCGAVSAGCGAGAGIAYLMGGGFEEVKHTLVNAMAIASGMICDGAKASCAAKIATSVDAGLMAYHMYRCGNQFYAGDGIVKKGIEPTIRTVGELAHDGMADTDREIIKLMMDM